MSAEIEFDQRRWHAVRVRTREEQVSAQILQDRGIDVFLPTYTETRQWSDRSVQATRALFAGYLFCNVKRHEHRTVLMTPKVLQIVCMAGAPVPIEEEEIQTIRRTMMAGANTRPHEYLWAGMKIRVEDGPLAGLTGILAEVKTARRLVVSVDLLRRSIVTELVDARVAPLTTPVSVQERLQ